MYRTRFTKFGKSLSLPALVADLARLEDADFPANYAGTRPSGIRAAAGGNVPAAVLLLLSP